MLPVSNPGTSTAIYLESRISEKYSPTPCTVTQDVNFDLDSYAQEADGNIRLDSLENPAKIMRLVFEAPRKRREGKGRVVEAIALAEFHLRYLEHTLIAVKATVHHDFSLVKSTC